MIKISTEQARDFALAIVSDIADYISNNRAAYEAWLKEPEPDAEGVIKNESL